MIWWSNSLPVLAQLDALHQGTLPEHLGVTFDAVGDDWLRARMPVGHRTHQPYGRLHGGASVALAETVGSIAASCRVDPDKFATVGMEINANHLRPVRDGWVCATARPEALTAIAQAQWITMGPGSWFSSVIPHLLVPAQLVALESAEAKKVLILNLDASPNLQGEEFAGSSPEQHLEFFHRYAPGLRVDYCLVDQSVVRNRQALDQAAATLGGEIVVADVRKAPGSIHHDSEKLALHLGHIFSQ